MRQPNYLIICLLTVIFFGAACKKSIDRAYSGNTNGGNEKLFVNAGADQIIGLPRNYVTLTGSSSPDPGGKSRVHQWTRITGPESFQIMWPDSVQTTVKNLQEGTYLFELQVSYSNGQSLKDTVAVTVKTFPINISCTPRPQRDATLTQVGTLSIPRTNLVSASVEGKVVFAGGWAPGSHSTRVDIYDIHSNTWSTAELSQAERDGMAVTTIGNKVFFAGGGNNDWFDLTSRVDIYDASMDTWTIAELSQPRNYLSATTLGNKVFFAGGGIWGPLQPGSIPNYHIGSPVVDIYDNNTNTWSTAQLSEGRFELSATSVGNEIYFAGGIKNIYETSGRIDIYNGQSNTWKVSDLSRGRTGHGSIGTGNKIMWCAGASTSYHFGYTSSDIVEIRDVVTGTTTFNCVTPKVHFETIEHNGDIIFFTGKHGGTKFDIYHTSTGLWSFGVLPFSLPGATIVSANGNLYVAGGIINGVYSDKVWKLTY